MSRPDERFTLASERTFLAWIRTALGLLAGGIAMIHLVPEFSTPAVRTLLGLVLILAAAGVAATGLRRWQKVKRALETGAEMPSSTDLWVVAIAVGGVALVAAVVTVVSAFV
ncbi:hypothetical protein GCM10007304_05220 [Rhodococcoides trifolii]|uniref:DUF202 domain-containing protein n=1 Tax=Rhodococcoides trifolii TaxID=908250 RepID=A0A917FP97_9NOCA|nr:DUF202 domain-containing protein [Rhodococcus trifolii]GGF94356.1 hypothetical protein GCM10007304_05220 [Rhodococcus trifolii]